MQTLLSVHSWSAGQKGANHQALTGQIAIFQACDIPVAHTWQDLLLALMLCLFLAGHAVEAKRQVIEQGVEEEVCHPL